MAKSRLETMGVSWLALLAVAFTGCGGRVAIEDNSGTGGAVSTTSSTGTDTATYTNTGSGYSPGSTPQTSFVTSTGLTSPGTGTVYTGIGTGSSVGTSYTGTSIGTGHTTSSIAYTGVGTGYTTATGMTAVGTGTVYTSTGVSTGVYTASVVQTATSSSTNTNVGCYGSIPAVQGQLSVTSGYVTAGTLRGYAFTWSSGLSTPSTCIIPTCSTTGCTPAFGTSSICATGMVAADMTYNSVAGLGFNLNQSVTGDMLGTVAAPAYVTVNASLFGGGVDARVQLSGANGIYYCVEAGRWVSGVPIPITNFNSSCWDGTGMTLYSGAPISAINLVIPSDATAERRFSLCLTNVTFL
jgi:hypothetical protein